MKTFLGNIDTHHYDYTPDPVEWFYDLNSGKQFKYVDGRIVYRNKENVSS